MKISSVRARLTLWNMGILALALVGFGALVHATVKMQLSRSVDQQLYGSVRMILMDNGFDRKPPPRFGFGLFDDGDFMGPSPQRSKADRRREMNRDRNSGRDPRPQMFDLKGAPMDPFSTDVVIDNDAFQKSRLGDTVWETIQRDKSTIRVFSAPFNRDGRRAGIVQIYRSLDELNALIRGMDRTLFMLIPLALLLSGVGGAFLTDRALRPVRRISQAAQQVSAEDLSRRLPTEGGDEFAQLAASFNGMFGRLDDAFRNLEEAYERQRRFTADASHELRTPLTTIKANTSLTLSGRRTPEQYRHALEAADRAADMMNRIVQDLLLLARSDSGRLKLEKEPLPILEILQRANAAVSRNGDSAKTAIVETPSDLMTYGDSHHLIRLFSNLLDNALRHTPSSGSISIRARESEGKIEAVVEDTGEGIPPEHLKRICERFYRVDAARSRAQGGVGLGLAICQSIVHEHGGSIAIESEPGRGTKATVLLPLFRMTEDEEVDSIESAVSAVAEK